MNSRWKLRLASRADVSILTGLIRRSALELQQADYSSAQIALALGPVFGVDRQLIDDGTYFVVEADSELVACGGWSFRTARFGGSDGRIEAQPRLDPNSDAARIRAFFVEPVYSRQGIGSALMEACEAAAIAMGFRRIEITATLAGERLYRRFGYSVVDRIEIPLDGAPAMAAVTMLKLISA